MLRVYAIFCFVVLVSCGTESNVPAPDFEPKVYRRVAGPDLIDPRDKQVYPTVVIGRQVWMARNLSFDTLDGTWSRCPATDTARCATGGRFYTWPLAMRDTSLVNWCDVFNDKRGICPSGWHLPDTAEWDSLATALGGMDKAGRILKSIGGWSVRPDGKSGSDSDRVGFSALPSGVWAQGGQGYGWYGHTAADSAFLDAGYRAAFWTRTNQTNFSCTSAWGAFLSNEDDGIRLLTMARVNALNIRCVRDRDTALVVP
ncbi:MAG: FISUMP domain-containing protein [Fibrobacterota bacterium]